MAYGPGLIDRVRALAPVGVGAALDGIGGEAIGVSIDLGVDRQRVGSIGDPVGAERLGVRRLGGPLATEILADLAGRFAKGDLVLPIWRSFPLARAADAHREIETGHVRGKVVLLAP